MCKPWKINGFRTEKPEGEKYSDHRRRYESQLQENESIWDSRGQ